jgi:hypothetical protein
MPELCNGQLVEALGLALETMGFVSLSPPEGPTQAPDDPVIVQVEYHNPRRGRVELVTSRDLGRLLLDNTLGADPSEAQALPNPTDPLVELLNIACGRFLKGLAAGSSVQMSMPRVTPFDAGCWESFTSHAGCDVVLAEGIVVAIRIVEE